MKFGKELGWSTWGKRLHFCLAGAGLLPDVSRSACFFKERTGDGAGKSSLLSEQVELVCQTQAASGIYRRYLPPSLKRRSSGFGNELMRRAETRILVVHRHPKGFRPRRASVEIVIKKGDTALSVLMSPCRTLSSRPTWKCTGTSTSMLAGEDRWERRLLTCEFKWMSVFTPAMFIAGDLHPKAER